MFDCLVYSHTHHPPPDKSEIPSSDFTTEIVITNVSMGIVKKKKYLRVLSGLTSSCHEESGAHYTEGGVYDGALDNLAALHQVAEVRQRLQSEHCEDDLTPHLSRMVKDTIPMQVRIPQPSTSAST